MFGAHENERCEQEDLFYTYIVWIGYINAFWIIVKIRLMFTNYVIVYFSTMCFSALNDSIACVI